MVKNPDMRMQTEETIASQMPNTIAVPAYKLVTNEELADISEVKKNLVKEELRAHLSYR